MSEHSGKFARLGAVSTSSGWTLNETNDSQKYSTSNLACGMGRRRGKFDWNGTVKGYGEMPPFMPGQIFPFQGFTAPDNDVSGPGTTAVGNAIVTQAVITWGFADAAILNWQLTFAGHLKLNWLSNTITDTTDVVVPSVCGTKVDILQGTEFEEMGHVTEAVLTLTNEVKEFTNTSTFVDGVCCVGRRAGLPDFTLAISQECTDRDESGGLPDAPPIGSDREFRLFVNNTDFWGLRWAHVTGYSGLTADNETADIITRTINFEKNGFNGGLGRVSKPDGSNFWPATSAPAA